MVYSRPLKLNRLTIPVSAFRTFCRPVTIRICFIRSSVIAMGDNDIISEPVVQYILIRTDLKSSLKWSNGAITAQACHACIAAVHTYYSNEDTQIYLKNLNTMHKIILQVPDEKSLKSISETLKDNNIDFYQWFENPDNIYTSIALRPYPKSKVESFFKSLKLYRN